MSKSKMPNENSSADSQCSPPYRALPRNLQEVRTDLQEQRPILAQHLKDAGVAYVRAHYEGSSDEGMLDDVEFLDTKDQVMTVPPQIMDLAGTLT